MRAALPLIAVLVAHLAIAVVPAWRAVERTGSPGDFASFHHAAVVASSGGNPYDTAQLAEVETTGRPRHRAHPYVYPPAFLVGVAWMSAVEEPRARQLWFALNELALLAAVVVAWTRFPRFRVAMSIWLVIGAVIPSNLRIGQSNLLVFSLTMLGVMSADQPRDPARPEAHTPRAIVGGALIGLAASFKLVPIVVLAWLAWRRRWLAVGAGLASLTAVSAAALVAYGPATTVDYLTRVLPGMSSGDYNGLRVRMAFVGNHSLSSAVDRVLGTPGGLDGTDRLVATVLLAAVLAIIADTALRHRSQAPDARAALFAALCAATLLVPAYAFTHHLIWLMPSLVVCSHAWWCGRLSHRWLPVLLLAAAAWCIPPHLLRSVLVAIGAAGGGGVAWGVTSIKLGGIVAAFAASIAVARSNDRRPCRAPAPESLSESPKDS